MEGEEEPAHKRLKMEEAEPVEIEPEGNVEVCVCDWLVFIVCMHGLIFLVWYRYILTVVLYAFRYRCL